MTGLTLAIIIISLILILIAASKKLRKKPYTRIAFAVSVLTGILLLYMDISGSRLTPLQASRANSYVEKKAQFLKEIKVEDNYLHVYYNPGEKLYRTTITEKSGIFYKSISSTFYYPQQVDQVRTLGGANLLLKGSYEAALYIDSKDPQVKEFAVIDDQGNYTARQPVKAGEAVVLQYKFPAASNSSNYKIIALNEDLDVLYWYGIELKGDQTGEDHFRWQVMKNEKLDNKFAFKIKSGNLVTNYKIEQALSDIDILGLNTLNIPVVVNIKDRSASDMSLDSYSKEQAITLIKKLRGRNINIILEPYPWIANGSEYETNWKPKNMKAFFENWRTKVIKPLIEDIAQPYHVEALYIGSNFSQMEAEEEQFCKLADYVKSNYKGLVTYRTNWWRTAAAESPFSKKEKEELKSAYEKKLNSKLFSKLDFISVAAYFELTENNTNTVDNLVSALQSSQIYGRGQNIQKELLEFNTKWNKPVFFGELGFPPKEKASVQPYNPYLTDKKNGKEQANCFEAYRRVFEKESWHLGFSVFAVGSREQDNNYYPSEESIEIIKGWYSK